MNIDDLHDLMDTFSEPNDEYSKWREVEENTAIDTAILLALLGAVSMPLDNDIVSINRRIWGTLSVGRMVWISTTPAIHPPRIREFIKEVT